MPKIRASLSALLGEWVSDVPPPPPQLPDGLPDRVAPVAAAAIAMLVAYQGPAYARLYLMRLSRFTRRHDVDDAMLADIAGLMAQRMAYRDPIRIAQLVLAEPGTDRVCSLRIDEMVSALPDMIADPIVGWLRWAGLSRRRIVRRFSAANAWSRQRLRAEASLRRWRLLSARYEMERLWVERWLHMIARALDKQPAAAPAVVHTAAMVQGDGDGYWQGLADWHLIIDGLVKPVFDGDLALPDLAGAIARARAAAMPDPRQASLQRTVAVIRAEASASL